MRMFAAIIRAVVALVSANTLFGCGGLPADQAADTPAAQIARSSLYSVQSNGISVGAAVAVPCLPCGGPVLVTNGHVMRQAGERFELRPAAGGEPWAGQIMHRSSRMDLAVLRLPPGAVPALLAAAPPSSGTPVWAVGPEGLGRAVAQGRVARETVRMRHFGPGFSARLGALMGFSGGPVVDRHGRLVGLTTALASPGQAPVMAALTGVDMDGFLNGDSREVFVLSINAIQSELGRLCMMRGCGIDEAPD